MLMLGMTVSLLWSTHFLLLGAVTGAAMNALSALRCYVYYRVKPVKRNLWVPWLFMGLLCTATIFTWQGAVSLLPLAGSLCSILASWQRRPKAIRRLSLGSSPPWFVYNFISGSYPGMVVEVLLVMSNLIGQYRFDFKHPAHRRLLHATKAA